jgi:translation initiation factor 5A
MDDAGNTKDDLKLPTDDEIASAIKAGFDEGKELVVTVLKAMGEEQIHAVKDGGAAK